ncbi:hypothetical protein GCM10027360_82270 [Amycolatopsis echigonensis]
MGSEAVRGTLRGAESLRVPVKDGGGWVRPGVVLGRAVLASRVR